MEDKYASLPDGVYAVMETTKGDIVLKLEYEKTPLTVANFVGLAEGTIKNEPKNGKPYYDGLKFHRVVDGFVIQGGCPLGLGTGGPGYRFEDEFDVSLTHKSEGILSMANAGPGTNGSQFFITLAATPHLDGKHSVFGEVVKGMDIVKKIKQGDVMQKVSIIRIGKNAKNFIVDDNFFVKLKDSAKEKAIAYKKEKQKAELEKISKMFPGAETTDSGLMFIVRKEGKGGNSPKYGSKVITHYEGKLLNGQVFDSSYQRGEPLDFQIGQVIEGWNEALCTMTKGEKRTLIIPPELGYGEYGAGGVIPPNAWLVFEVELIDFK